MIAMLPALIALLSDSYSRVQEKATANQRKERAEVSIFYGSNYIFPFKLTHGSSKAYR